MRILSILELCLIYKWLSSQFLQLICLPLFELVHCMMDFVSSLGWYGLKKFVDVAASVLLRFGIRYLDRIMDGGFTSVGGQESGPGSGVVAVPMEDIGGSEPGAVAGAVAGTVAGAEVEGRLPDCGDYVVEFLEGSEVSLVVS